MTTHAAVWIDHKEARIFLLHPGTMDETIVRAPPHSIHHKHPVGDNQKAHPDDAKRFFHEVANALGDTGEVLVVGPGSAKLELVKWAHAHKHALEHKIVGLATVDHPTDGQIVAFAKHYFVKTDALR